MKKVFLIFGVSALASGCAILPDPFTSAELSAQSDKRLAEITADQEPITRPVTLYEAMARAIRYNLDYKVEMMDEALKSRELKLAKYDLLPQLVVNAGYVGRNNFSGASSSRLLDDRVVGDQSLVASTSAERKIYTNDIAMSWDVLDFGLSYVRAKQKSDEVLIASERRRKVVARIIEDVRTAYWRAVSAERLIEKLSLLEDEISDALETSDRAYERRKTPPLSALTYQRELLTIKEEIHDLERELIIAKQQLAALMNVDPGQPFELVLPDRAESRVEFAADPERMIETALQNRPELREISYRQRINDKEATAALLDLLPSLRAYGGFNYDSNDFLFNNHWAGWGVQASKNLVEAFRYPARRKTVKAQDDLLEQRALALTMAVMTQVHVSLTRFEIAKRRVETMENYYNVQDKILKQINAGYSAKRISRQTYIREQMNDIVAEAKYDLALADLQNAFANIHASMGLNPYGPDVSGDEDVMSLTKKLERHWSARGDSIAFEEAADNEDEIVHVAAAQ